jgi:hypothetical protein
MPGPGAAVGETSVNRSTQSQRSCLSFVSFASFRSKPLRRTLRWLVTLAAVGVVVLVGPAASWLQGREFRAAREATPDALYLLAGEKDQARRLEAIRAWTEAAADGDRRHSALILIGNDGSLGKYSRAAQRSLTLAEWAVVTLEADGFARVAVVPGGFYGTDGEMAALAAYLEERPDLRSVTLVTSPYHARRVVRRLAYHLHRNLEISVALACPHWKDRAPWTVLAELLKIARDELGLSDAPFVSRAWYARPRPAKAPEQPQGKAVQPTDDFPADELAGGPVGEQIAAAEVA